MRVLAIDPGYDRVGVAIVEREDGRDVCVYSNCVTTPRSDTPLERLFAAGEAVRALIERYTPTHFAIETLFFNNNQKTAMHVAEARGIFLYLARRYTLTIHEFSPQEIKVAMTGYGKSDKKAVIDMVSRLVKNVPEKALDDEYDAIAVGVTALAHIRE